MRAPLGGDPCATDRETEQAEKDRRNQYRGSRLVAPAGGGHGGGGAVLPRANLRTLMREEVWPKLPGSRWVLDSEGLDLRLSRCPQRGLSRR